MVQSVKFMVDGESGTQRQPFGVDKMGELKLVHPLDFEKFTEHQVVVWISDGLTVRKRPLQTHSTSKLTNHL